MNIFRKIRKFFISLFTDYTADFDDYKDYSSNDFSHLNYNVEQIEKNMKDVVDK